MAYEKRFVDNLIGGMIIRIAKFGETITTGNVVGEGAKPDAPTPEKPGPWLTLGKIKTATSERQKKTATVEGVNDAGYYEMRDLSIAQQSKLKFTTQEVTPEAIQLASDPVTCEFELSIKNSPLATFTSLALAKLAAD